MNVQYICVMRIIISFIFILSFAEKIFSQDSLKFFAPSPEFNKTRFVGVVCLETVGYGGSLVLLSNAWYKDYKQKPRD